ncbi:hypothetical protein [Botrimarina hoheduenensis]|uniref:AAA+ ATPase domain-containing protein n=1 Tax=Botrimarina hoheduenensis TaxID=2528000 RepID=A0A5C5VNI2_9BACT|nr:hypothetical protein [Botrimarina hoheduenensis]TWT40236.1 hypothetical protein Pla111_33680 [Botrimarina hoheduenensis]
MTAIASSAVAVSAAASIPSRSLNPFATCWTGTGKLAHVETRALSLPKLQVELERLGYRGQVVGPHGVGKSVLVRSLAAHIGGPPSIVVTTPARALLRGIRGDRRTLLVIEGLERWSMLLVGLWTIFVRWSGLRVLVTTHRVVRGIPVLTTLSPSAEIFALLFDQLTRERPTPISLSEAAACFHAHGGDYRATWLALHLEHERRRGQPPVGPCRVAFR